MREFYASSNGDRWLLAHDGVTGRVFVRHMPNIPSGGTPKDIHLGAFLSGSAGSAEHQSLIKLIATLTDEATSPVAQH